MNQLYKDWLEHPVTEHVLDQLREVEQFQRETAQEAFIHSPFDVPEEAQQAAMLSAAYNNVITLITSGEAEGHEE